MNYRFRLSIHALRRRLPGLLIFFASNNEARSARIGRIATFIGESEVVLPSTTPHGRLHSIPGLVDALERWIARTNSQRYRSSAIHPFPYYRCSAKANPKRAEMLYQSEIRPCRAPWLTASARLLTPSLEYIEEIWNLTVCSLMCSSRAIILLDNPRPSRPSTSLSRAVSGSESSSTAAAGSSSNLSARVFGSTVRPWATAATAAPSSSDGASGGTTPQPLRDRVHSLDAAPSSSESNSSDCVPSSETESAVSSSNSSSATSTTSTPESGGTGPADRPTSPTTSKSADSTDASIERSPARMVGVGATTNTRVGVMRRVPRSEEHTSELQ